MIPESKQRLLIFFPPRDRSFGLKRIPVTQKSCPWFGYSGLGIYHDHLGVRASPATGYIRISNW